MAENAYRMAVGSKKVRASRGNWAVVGAVFGALAAWASLAGLIWSLRADMRTMETGIRADMRALEAGIRADVRALAEVQRLTGERVASLEARVSPAPSQGRSDR